MTAIFIQDETPLDRAVEAAGTVKDGLEAIEKAGDALDAIKAAIEYASSADADPVEALSLLGKALGLAKEFAPPGMDKFIETYASAIDAISKSLASIPLTAYDRAIDRAYDETGDPAKAAELAGKILPDTPAADRARGIKRATLKHLKKTTVPKKASFWDSKWFPWNWLSSAPIAPGVAAAALGMFFVVFLFAFDCTGRPLLENVVIERDGGDSPSAGLPLPAIAGLELGGGGGSDDPNPPGGRPQVLGPIVLCPGESRSFVLGPYLSNVVAGPVSSNAAVAGANVTNGGGDRDVSDTITITAGKPGTATISLTAEQWQLNFMGNHGQGGPGRVGHWRLGDIDILVKVPNCDGGEEGPPPPGLPGPEGPRPLEPNPAPGQIVSAAPPRPDPTPEPPVDPPVVLDGGDDGGTLGDDGDPPVVTGGSEAGSRVLPPGTGDGDPGSCSGDGCGGATTPGCDGEGGNHAGPGNCGGPATGTAPGATDDCDNCDIPCDNCDLPGGRPATPALPVEVKPVGTSFTGSTTTPSEPPATNPARELPGDAEPKTLPGPAAPPVADPKTMPEPGPAHDTAASDGKR